MPQEPVAAIDDLSEEARARRITGMYKPALIPPTEITSHISSPLKPRAIFTGVDIRKATRKPPATLNRPHLPCVPKKPALGYALAKAIEENEEVISKMISVILKNIKIENDVLLELSEKEREKIEKCIDQLSSQYGIDTVKGILSCASSANAIVIGSLLGPEIGGFLVVSGFLTLIGNEILPRTNFFQYLASFFTSDEDKQKNAAGYMQITTTIASTVVSFAASFAVDSDAFKKKVGENIGKVIQRAIDTGSALGNATSDLAKRKLKILEVDKTEIDRDLQDHNFNLENHRRNLANTTKLSENFISASRESILMVLQMNKKANESLRK